MIDTNQFEADMATAISVQNRGLRSRIETDSHKAFIRNATKINTDDHQFITMLKSVFSHHDTADFRHLPFQNLGIDNPEDISRFFHHHSDYYLQPNIVQGLIDSNPSLTYDELYRRIIPEAEFGEQNFLSFLVGGVGIGKTTFICNFICRNISKLATNGWVPVKINLDISTAHTVPNDFEILEVVKRSILSALRNNNILSSGEVERLAMDCNMPNGADKSSIDANLSHLTSLLKERYGKRVFLVIDNIDFLYHLGDRGFFAEGGADHPERSKVRQAHATIVEIIKMFWLQSDRFCSRLGISILIACRQDTIEYLISQHHEVPLESIEERLFSLSPPTLERAKVVVSKRFDLMDRLAEKIEAPAKRKEYLVQISRLRQLYKQRSGPGQALLDDLWRLSRKGLRDMINQISEFSWLEFLDGQKSALNSRFTQQYYPSMLAYMLAGRRRYTQFSGNVPNIFLINAPSPSNEVGVPKEFKEQHLYTLWLKKLILSFLMERKGIATNDMDVVRMFCGKSRRGYSESLVRYVLSSLFEVPTSELIEVDVGADGAAGTVGYIKQIDITERGEFLLTTLADSFKYLQLAVDDWKILLPKPLITHFGYIDPDYSYLVYEEGEYGVSLEKILERKGRQTFLFALLIEEMLELEQRTWPKVFERLESEGVKYYQSGEPTMRIRREIEAVRNAVRSGANLSYLENESERRARAVFRSTLEELFLPCKDFRVQHYGSW